LIKLGTTDVRARGYKAAERILNICINCANYVKWAQNTVELFQPRGCSYIYAQKSGSHESSAVNEVRY